MSDAPELKPCPFCGGEAEFHSLLPRYDDAFVCCPNCEIDGPRFGGNDDREGSNAQAIAAWNTRAALREIEELEAKVQSLTALLDNQLGTPCEQVRHQEQVEALEAKLAESEARSEVLEELVMDVAADLYDGVDAYKIDQRIMDVFKQLDEEEEEDQ